MQFGHFNPQFGKLYQNQRSNYHHHYPGLISKASRPERPGPPIEKVHARDQKAGKGDDGDWDGGLVRADGTGAEFCELGARKHAVIRESRLIRVARVDHPPNELCGLMERWDLHWKIFIRT